MKAIVTGASSGIGRDIAYELAKKGYDLVLVARRMENMKKIADDVSVKCDIECMDLTDKENCFLLYEKYKNDDIGVLVNCAGFGVFGEFVDTDLNREINMINTNITALHIITKQFLCKFVENNKGYILNVASSAAFAPGPLLSSYYASKAYVLRLSQAIWEELRRNGSDVSISVLCPGPVDTEFNSVADVSFTVGSLKSDYVAKYAVDKMFKKTRVIVPGVKMKLARLGSKLCSSIITSKITYRFQKKKCNN